MPKESLSVYLTIQDGASPTLSSITDKTKALNKESQLLQKTTDALTKANQTLLEKQGKLQSELSSATKTVKEAQKAYDDYEDELSKARLDSAIEQHTKLKNELMQVTEQLNSNKRAYKENIEAIRKGETGGQETSLSSMAKGLFAGQIGQMFSSSVGGLFQFGLTSAIGTPEASLISDMLSSAISGGTAGAMFGVPGIAAGAALGGFSGLISGQTKIWQEEDDAFKTYYGGLYGDVSARSDATVESGSTIAGGREQTRMAFSRRLGGDEEADAYLRQVEIMAAKTNYDYDEIVGYAKLLLNSYDPEEVFGVLRDLSDATAGLNLSSGDVNMMIAGLSRMRTTGKATQEYLNYFRERGVDTDQALVDYYQEKGEDVEKSAIADMVRGGTVKGGDAAEAILTYIEKTFGGLSDDLAGTYDAMVDNLGDITASLEARGGTAYNDLRKEGIQAKMDALEGALGDAIGEVNAIMGENRARKENLEAQYYNEVVGAVLTGEHGELWDKLDEKQQGDLTSMNQEYAALRARYEASRDADGKATDAEAGARMEALYEEAQGLAKAYFENSDFVQMLNDVELDEITALRENTAGLNEATQAAYRLTQELSKGIVSTVTWQDRTSEAAFTGLGISAQAVGGDAEGAAAALAGTEVGGAGQANPVSGLLNWLKGAGTALTAGAQLQNGDLEGAAKTLAGSKSHAFGLSRVPYDDYPALLHEGERVLTASEARGQDAGAAGQGISLTVTGNSFVGTGEEMADQLWEIIMRKLEREFIAAGR